jgi:hypothetical protein
MTTHRSTSSTEAGGQLASDRTIGHVEPVYSMAKHKVMSSEEYYASEFSDDYLAAQADAGDYFLNESGFQYRLNSAEISELVREGQHWLVIDKILGRDCGT